MAPIVFRCPNTGLRLQGWIADDPDADGRIFVAMLCTACKRSHLVNPNTGKTLGDDAE
jgi:hypothetical protein